MEGGPRRRRAVIRVRPLAPADEPAVAALAARCELSGWDGPALAAERARPFARLLVAEAPALAGFVAAWVIDAEAEILAIGVAPEARGRGVGRALLEAALEGARAAHLEVRATNTAARALYARCGFVGAGVRRGYYADGEDALLMAWSPPASP
ncbi:MAG: GNAT family N-acetyltransferase [Sandaracinaceae bacterium]|nr:GNAT family N-acetyltransferase [Sandaracinaceae bacterium]